MTLKKETVDDVDSPSPRTILKPSVSKSSITGHTTRKMGTGGDLPIYGGIVRVTQKQILKMIKECVARRKSFFTAWELDFLNRLEWKIFFDKPFLDREVDKLHSIWSKNYETTRIKTD